MANDWDSWLSTQLPTAKIPRYVRSHHSTLLAWVVDAGFVPLPFMCPLLKFLSSFVSRLSFPSTSWLCLKISGWRQGGKYIWVLVPRMIKFGWQLHQSNWAPMSALRSVVIILLLLLFYFLFWCCKIQWRGSKTADCLLLKLQSILLEIGFCVGYKTFSYNFINSIHFLHKRLINISLWG